MLKADKKQKQILAILTKGDKELKKLLVQQACEDETKTSTNDLTHAQANRIIVHLGGKPVYYDNWALFDKTKASHRQILSLCIQYGWSVPHPTRDEVADIGALSEWLKSDRSPVRKKLKEMNTHEVSKVISALEFMVNKKYRK